MPLPDSGVGVLFHCPWGLGFNVEPEDRRERRKEVAIGTPDFREYLKVVMIITATLALFDFQVVLIHCRDQTTNFENCGGACL